MGRHQSYPRVAHFLWTFLLLLGTTINAQQIPPATRTIEIDSNLLCSAEGGLAQMDDKNGGGNVPMPCSSDSDCFPPANCHSTHKICCIFPLDQEAPPVGCPKGTRQLRNAKGDWLNCVPTKPGSCPGGALCYEDSLEPNQFRCCGKDPGEGCGIGQRVLRHENGSSQLCVPGGDGAARECPGNAICEWSFAIDRFQCCEPDNGCLDSEAPLFDANDEVLSCSPAHSQSCPSEAAVCRFNFWTASFQCCAPSAPPSIASIRRMIEKAGGKHVEGGEGGGERGTPSAKECPAGEIPYLLETAAVPDLAAQQQQQEQWCASDMDCPPMAHCHAAMGLCCGPPGECPRPAENPIFDEHGHIRLCSLQQPDLCPPDSKCRETVDPLSGLPTGQRVCCGSFSFQCAASGSPFPSEENPLRCELDNPITCPMDMLCQASNLPGVSICCRADGTTFWAHGQHHRNLCPRGWLPYGQLNIFCHPTLHGSCPGRSACILSPTSGQFVCCQPIGSEERRRMAMAMDAGGRGGAMVRKGNGAALSCPNPDDTIDTMQGGHPRQCTVDKRVPCRKGFLCEPSAEDPILGVCCSQNRSAANQRAKKQHRSRDQQSGGGGAIFRCPTAAQVPVLRQGQNVFCDMPGQQCPAGSSCQSALNSFAMMICCRNARQNSPVCPEGMRPEQSPIGYVLCELLQPNQCTEGFQCVRSRDDPEQSLCCARQRNARPASIQYICPNQQVLFKDGPGPRFCPPNAQQPCPRGYSCEEAVGQSGIFVCCSVPAQPVCPAGFDASLDFSGSNPIYCSISDQSMCPADANCMPAENRANTFLCCISREPGRICPQSGQHALLQPNGQPEQCSGPGAPCSKASYSCQLSYTLNNRYVCCGPPGTSILCADGRETYQQELGKTVQCNPISLYSECPAGFECALSSVPNLHVCCRRMEAPQPTPQAPTDLGPSIPLQPAPAATFRPPVEELSCPVGWSAFEDQKGAHHFCQDALDMTCPHGFSCAQSSVNGIFMCCRLASAIQCPAAYSTLMVNNNPRLCSSLGAPRQSGTGTGNIGTVAGSPTAASSSSTAFNSCPPGYSCMQSSVPAVYVCCGSNTLPATGPFGGRGELYCSDGQIPAYLGQYLRYCQSIGQTSECPPSYVCALSNRPGLYVCCHPFPVRRRSAASSAQPMLVADHPSPSSRSSAWSSFCGKDSAVALEPSKGEPMECRHLEEEKEGGGRGECPKGFHCQPSLANAKMYCCKNGSSPVISPRHHSPSAQICPEGREPYRETANGDFLVCGDGIPQKCPGNFVCKQSRGLVDAARICCSSIPFCPGDKMPQIESETGQARRCDPALESSPMPSCAPPFRCQPSTLDRIFVCCSPPSPSHFTKLLPAQ